MPQMDKRKKSRIDSHNLVSYVCLDRNGHEFKQGIGRTLNISEGGILLETYTPMDPGYTVSLSVGLGEDIRDFKGKITHSVGREGGKYENGIEFLTLDEDGIQFLRQIITIFEEDEEGS